MMKDAEKMTCTKLALDGFWRLTSPDLPGREIRMRVPGDHYSALREAGIIPDPYWGTNEKKVQKYADMLWHLERDFQVGSELLKHKKILLELEWLDTLVSVFINGKKIFETDNMFRRYRKDIKKYLKAGENQIKFTFHPVIPEGARRSRKLLRWTFLGLHGTL